MSLMDNPQLFGGRIIAWPVRLANYPEAWVKTKIGTLYWNSIYISTVSMVLTVAMSALAGYGLGRLDFIGKQYIYVLILIGLTIPLQIALIPLVRESAYVRLDEHAARANRAVHRVRAGVRDLHHEGVLRGAPA